LWARHRKCACRAWALAELAQAFGLTQLVLEFVKGLLDLPTQPVAMRDDARRQGVFAGQEAELLAPHHAVGTPPPHAPALAGRPQFIGEHAGRAWVGLLPGIVPEGCEPPVVLLPAPAGAALRAKAPPFGYLARLGS